MKKATKNHIGPGSQHSSRAGSSYMARLKAEIDLDKIATFVGRVYDAPAFTFEVLYPAATTSDTQPQPDPA